MGITTRPDQSRKRRKFTGTMQKANTNPVIITKASYNMSFGVLGWSGHRKLKPRRRTKRREGEKKERKSRIRLGTALTLKQQNRRESKLEYSHQTLA
jgi:hypothetical protein